MARGNKLNLRLHLPDLDEHINRFSRWLQLDVAHVGAAAMAKVIYDEAKIRAPVSTGPHVFVGTNEKYEFQAGNLRDSIYRVFSKDRSIGGLRTYHISWNHSDAPYGFMVEFGTVKMAARPFMRPAYEAKIDEAVEAGKAAMRERFEMYTGPIL